MKIYFHLNIEGFSNAYIIVNPKCGEAIMIDPGKITNTMINHLERDKYKLSAVFITHNHGSHTKGLTTLKKIYSPKIYGADYEIAGSETIVLRGDGVLKAAGLSISYIALPGHTPDSMVYKIGRCLFTGDSLLAGQTGNTNSAYARRTLIANLQTKILSQQESMTIMPGHGPPSTIGAEKKFNLDFGCPVLHKLQDLPKQVFFN